MGAQGGTGGAGAATAACAGSAAGAVDRADVSARLAVAVGRINRRIRPLAGGLSHGLLSALSTIVRTGPIRPGELARSEVVAAPTMTRAVADLEGRGLVRRLPDPGDGRSCFLEATDLGVEMVLRARSERADRVAALLQHLPDDDLATIVDALPALEATATAP